MKFKIRNAAFFVAIIVAIMYIVVDRIFPFSGIDPKIGRAITVVTVSVFAGGILVAGTIESVVKIRYHLNNRRLEKMTRYISVDREPFC
jgi:hypothetical protein